MTADQRLDQLEPLMAEQIAQLDLHTAQLRRVNLGIKTITQSVLTQGENVVFLLNKVSVIEQDVSELKQRMSSVEQVQAEHTQMLTAILNILQKRSDN
jgi:septal ring factor EnvC (AmiA/AmiB activator)